MKKVNSRNLLKYTSQFLLAILLTFSNLSFGQDAAEPAIDEAAATQAPVSAGADPAAGEALFKANCAACHKMDKKAVGPALRGVSARHDMPWLYTWIRNSQGMIASGDAKAVALFAEYNKSVMTSFPALSDADIDNIIAYTDQPKAAVVPVTGGGEVQTTGTSTGGVSNTIVIAALALVFLLLVMMLFLVTNTLKRIAEANGVVYETKEKRTPIWKAFVQNQFLVLVTAVFLILAGAYFVYGFFMQVGVDQGYMPVQPIHYSHRIHAGSNEIDCKYCHSSARVSKHSGIPSLNVCMNCHKNIGEVSQDVYDEGMNEYGVDYNKEIQKLYKAVGWDSAEQKYTGETEPVKWVRIHNLPDFAYFNHSQHVVVAGIECQKCHGPVQEMEVMYQFAPLTMGWCINCHRETNVNLGGNEYYTKIHEELSKKYGVDKLTIAQLGGIECGKCHY